MAALDSRLRSAITLGVLAAVFAIGLAWAWSAVTEPFPERVDTPACRDTQFAAGEVLRTTDVLVNVMNAGTRDGLARTTMDQLIRYGFAEGERDNTTVPKGSPPAQVWTDDADNPAARLVRGFLGDNARIVEQQTTSEGITVVVGDQFPGVVASPKTLKLKDAATVCTPYDPGADD